MKYKSRLQDTKEKMRTTSTEAYLQSNHWLKKRDRRCHRNYKDAERARYRKESSTLRLRSYLGTATIRRSKSNSPRCQHPIFSAHHLEIITILILLIIIIIIVIIVFIAIEVDDGILFVLIFGDEVADVLISLLELHLVPH